MRQKRSIIWKIDKDELSEIVSSSSSISQILKHFNMDNKGGNYKTIKDRMAYDNIDYSHITLGLGSNAGRKFSSKSKPLEDILVIDSEYSRYHLKRRLIKENILDNVCSICGQLPMWNNQPMILILDHKNGSSRDNRIFNLRLLCPNCNSQTPTFAGRNSVQHKKIRLCTECDKTIVGVNVKRCQSCNAKHISRNIPSSDELQKLSADNSRTDIAKIYGVSETTVRKWMKKYNTTYINKNGWNNSTKTKIKLSE